MAAETAANTAAPLKPAPARRRKAKRNAIAPMAPEISSMLRALGHEGRLQLLDHLRDGPRTVAQLQELMQCSQPMVSSHLARLRYEGLVRFEKQGRCCYYRLADDRTRALLDQLDRVFCDGLRKHL